MRTTTRNLSAAGALLLAALLVACNNTPSATPLPTFSPSESTSPSEMPSPAETMPVESMPGSLPAESMPAASGDEMAEADVIVSLANMEFTSPEISDEDGELTLTMAVGDTLQFRNDDEMTHAIVEGTDGEPAEEPIFDFAMPVGDVAQYTFAEAGTYQVTCTLHPDMNLTIVVE